MNARALLLAALLAAPLLAEDRPCADGSTGGACGGSPFPVDVTIPPLNSTGSTEEGSMLPPAPDVQLSPSKLQVETERYPTGEVYLERRVYNKVPEGLTKEFYKNGQVMNEWNYRRGVLQGLSRSFYRNGDLKTEWRYKDGKLNGEVRQYHERKILKLVETYEDGVLKGRKEYEKKGLPVDKAH